MLPIKLLNGEKVTYTVLILPIVIARLIESSGKDVALAGMIFR